MATQSEEYQSHSQWLVANLSVLCNIRSVITQYLAICRFNTLKSLPSFTKENGYMRAKKWAAAAGFCNMLNWLIDRMIALAF